MQGIYSLAITKNIQKEFKEGEIWWCNLGINIGSEQNGTGNGFERPVLIIKIFSKNTALVFPLTSRSKVGSYYFKLSDKDIVILCQPRLIDTKRLSRRIEKIKISREQFKIIVEQFINLLKKSEPPELI